MVSLGVFIVHVFSALHCASAALEISSIMDSCGRLGGGYKQREANEKIRKLQTTKPSALAQYMVLPANFTSPRCPTPKNKVMSLLKPL